MKKLVLALALIPLLGWSQVKTGVTYSEHPAYDVIKKSYQIYESGTEAELRALYAEGANNWGPGDDEGKNNEQEGKGKRRWQTKCSERNSTDMKGATQERMM